MKHRIVGDRHQLLAVEMDVGEELFIFKGRHIFSRGTIEIRDTGADFATAGLADGLLLASKGGRGLCGLIPREGGHLKRVEITPPSGLVASVESVLVLSRGVAASVYSPPAEVGGAFEGTRFALFKGVGMAFLCTNENFMEFTLGVDEELCANARYIVAYSGGIKIKASTTIAGENVVIFTGPGNLILSSG